MRQSLLPAVLSAMVLVGCSPDRGAATAETDATAPPVAAPADSVPADTPPGSLSEPGEAGDTPVSNAPGGNDALARFDGYGDVKLGIAADAMLAAWGGDLKRLGSAEDTCYFMTPTWVEVPADFAFMVEEGKFVRYSTESTTFIAPGGGKVGMSIADIQSLYPGRIEQQPHKYTDGKYLRIMDAVTGNALLFETDGAGKITEWRVGKPPQVDYVEGCS